MFFRICFAAGLACGFMSGQTSVLALIPSEPMSEMHLPQGRPAAAGKASPVAETAPERKVQPSVLHLLAAGDPIYLVEKKPDATQDQWRTYSVPKVDPISRDGQGLALQGFDVVSYLDKHAEKGRSEYSFAYGGVTWLFATAEHLQRFVRQPEQYLPEYGGFCAYSIGRGYPATADPRVFTLDGTRLYLFFDKAVQIVWQQDQRNSVVAADRNWPKLHR